MSTSTAEGAGISLSLRRVSFGYNDIPLFNDLSLTIGAENPTAIMGPSGCGKTTLLRLAAGLLTPWSGDVAINGARGGDGGGGFAFVFQEPRLLPRLTVLENILLPVRRQQDRKAAVERALRFIEICGLTPKKDVLPDALSGGQQQRASIARAWTYPAPLILMDEPFQSLDIPLRIELMDAVKNLLKTEKRLVIAVTHDAREAIYLARRIIVLRNGRPVFDEPFVSPPEAYISASSAALERRLLGAMEFCT